MATIPPSPPRQRQPVCILCKSRPKLGASQPYCPACRAQYNRDYYLKNRARWQAAWREKKKRSRTTDEPLSDARPSAPATGNATGKGE